MKRKQMISLLLCMCMVVSLFTGFASTASAEDVITHTVENGEYLFKICKAYGLDYYQCKSAIMALNGFNSEAQLNRISVGQVIKLPASNAVAQTVKTSTTTTTTVSTATVVNGTTTTTSSTSTVQSNLAGRTVAYYLVPHVVAGGETLNSICNALGTNYYTYANVILGINGLASANKLQAGKTIYVPSATPAVSGNTYAVVAHSVASGETLTSICSQYGINYQSNKTLVNGLNSGTNLNKIYVGQTIYVPLATTAASAAVVSTGTTGTATSTTTSTTQKGFQISITAADYGNPYVVVGNTSYATRAEAGTAVVIKTNPNAGYAVKSIKVIRTDSGSNVTLVNNAFTMPESNVQITITYSQGYKISKASSAYGSFNALVYGYASTSAFYGDEVTVSLEPYSGYSVNKVYYVKTDNSSISKTVTADSAGVYKFSMPNYNITLFVEYKQTTYHKLAAHVIGLGTVTFSAGGKTVTQATKGTTVTATITPKDSNWSYDESVTVPKLSDSAVTLKKTSDNTYTFVVGDNDITMYDVTFVNVKTFNLTVGHTVTGGYITFTVTDARTGAIRYRTNWARKGDTVDIVYWPSNGYKPIAHSSATTDDDTADFTVLAPTGALLQSWTTGNRGCQFIMPDSDVTVRWPKFEKAAGVTQRTLTTTVVNNKGGMFYLSTDPSGVPRVGSIPSDYTGKIYIFAVPNTNCAVKYIPKYTINGTTADATVVTAGKVYCFDVTGTGTIKVSMEFKESLYTVQVYAVADGGVDDSSRAYEKVGITLNGAYVDYVNYYNNPSATPPGDPCPAEVVVGSRLNIWFNIMDGHEVRSVTKTGGSGDQTILPDGSGQYWYTITQADYDSGNAIKFEVLTQSKTEAEYVVLHGKPDSTMGYYIINVFDKITGAQVQYFDADAVAHEGDRVMLYVKSSAGYEMEQILKDSVVISGADIIRISPTESTYEFTMPARNVTTDVIFKSVTSYFSISYGGSGYTLYVEQSAAAAGEIVTLRAKPDDAGMIITKDCISGVSVPVSVTALPDAEGYYTITFTMPETTVSMDITPRYPEVYVETTENSDKLTWSYTSGTSEAVGSTVKCDYVITPSVAPELDKEVKSVSFTDETGVTKEITYSVNYTHLYYTGDIEFVMPPYDVTLIPATDYVEFGTGG